MERALVPQSVRTTCPYCGTGCGVLATPQPDGTVLIAGDPDHPANRGRLCSKGSALTETIGLEERLLYPEIGGQRASWDEAMDLVADRFRETIDAHGPDSVALYVSGQLLTEDYYAANKLMKGYIGSANIDTNSRLCMASSVAGHRRAFGTDTVPGCYDDLETCDLLVLAGSNLAWCHPVLFQRIAAAKEARPDMTVVLIDPRRTMTADIADLHLAIAPDGDLALFRGLLAHLADNGRIDSRYVESHVAGMDAAIADARALDRAELLRRTGLSEAEIDRFFALVAKTERTVTVYSQGINQSAIGTAKVNAIINCHLATGRIGKPGCGPFSVTGQPNAMGGREVGGLANMLAAHMDIENAGHRAIVQDFWSSPSIASQPGLKAVDLFAALAKGRVKALWIIATNPVVSLPDADAVERALASCPFVVVSDVSNATDTLPYAHVRLPAAAWGEKDGTVTNSERMISRQRAFLAPPGEARPDWWQVAEVARRLGHGAAFAWKSVADIFAEHAALSGHRNDGSRDFDISAHAGISRAGYDRLGPFQWPQSSGSPAARSRFFASGGFFTPDRKARALTAHDIDPAVDCDAYPMTLNTGRIRDQWHTMTRTGKSQRLSSHYAEPFAEIHPSDAERLGIAPASLVRLESPHGRAVLRALVSLRQQPGSVFVPMHWTRQFASAGRVGALVTPDTDPVSGQPASKHGQVRVSPFAPALYGFAISARRPDPAGAAYWAIARASGGWIAELGLDTVPENLTAYARRLFGADARAEAVSYSDNRTGRHRIALFDGNRIAGALFLSREPVAVSRQAVIGELTREFDDPARRFNAIAGRPAADTPDRGAIVCACLSIGVNQIAAAVRSGSAVTMEAIGELLKAGTNCGSCRAEIRQIIAANRPVAAE